MSFKDAIRSGFSEYLIELKQMVDGLTADELRWRPSDQSNHILWIVWHMARTEDLFFADLRQAEQVWSAGNWGERLGIDAENTGWDWSMEQVEQFTEPSVEGLFEYYDAVREKTSDQLSIMTDEELGQQFWGGEMKGSFMLGHALVEEAQHLGQIAYIRGMLRGRNG